MKEERVSGGSWCERESQKEVGVKESQDEVSG